MKLSCQRCGAELSYGGRGRRPKWCSERCRKVALYGGSCIDCGGLTNGYNGPGHASERCAKCAVIYCGTAEGRILRSQVAVDGAARWPEEAMLDALRRAYAIHGHLSIGLYRLMYDAGELEGSPSSQAFIQRFDTWDTALLAAGLPTNPHRRRRYKRTTADECLAAVRIARDRLGHIPTYVEYERIARDESLPSAALVRLRCGKWLSVIKALMQDEMTVAA